MARTIICKDCGEEKKYHAKGRCKGCYDRWYRQDYIRPLRICKECEEERPYKAKGLCIICYNRIGKPKKPCLNCGERKPHVGHGLCNRCYRNDYKQKNPERIRAINRRYRENGDKAKATWHCWWGRNRKKHNARHRRYREQNPEKVKADLCRWRQNNPEKRAGQSARRSARKRNLPSTLTSEQIEQKSSILHCFYCGRETELTFDHFVGLAAKGNIACGTTLANTVLACPKCNSAKKDKLPREILTQLSFKEARLEALNLGSQNEGLSDKSLR